MDLFRRETRDIARACHGPFLVPGPPDRRRARPSAILPLRFAGELESQAAEHARAIVPADSQDRVSRQSTANRVSGCGGIPACEATPLAVGHLELREKER